ncbi:hypothetical protein Csa_002454 [Cucumis sativus]|uniref:Uncharacterized protein n=1 Tax=Cucumis sativus TaxID=3659 RepID=A0A0A0LC49_CUCSA|nr:hypothetical protein Csa_002454 [Cucumis sativus]
MRSSSNHTTTSHILNQVLSHREKDNKSPRVKKWKTWSKASDHTKNWQTLQQGCMWKF